VWDFPPETPVIQVGTLLIDWDRCIVSVAGHTVDLTKKEMTLLCALALAHGRILSHGWLIDTIWTDENIYVSDSSLRQVIKVLRVKLGPERGRLKTVRDYGYRLDCD